MNAQRGMSLVELLLVVGVIAMTSAGIFVVAKNSHAAQQVDRQLVEFKALLKALDGANGSAIGHFSSVSAATVASEGLAPPDMIQGTGLRSVWGPIGLEPRTLDARRPMAHIRLTYDGVPVDQCQAFVRAAAKGQEAVHVSGVLVSSRGVINREQLVDACERGPASVAIDHDGSGGGDPSLL
ncbi:MAG: prepilin-type N-terminal cleavage/methylation domain-containing protein [Pseudomonas sp.]